MRVALFRGQSQYNVLNRATEEIADAFADAGHQSLIIDIASGATLGAVVAATAAQGPFDMGFTLFARLGESTDAQGHGIGDLLNLPMVLQYVDSPLLPQSQHCLDRTPKTAALLFVDRSHVQDVHALYGPQHFAHVGFCPHAALGAVRALPASADEYLATRPIPFLFAGSYGICTEPDWHDAPETLRNILTDTLDIALSQDWIPIRQALDQALAARNIDPQAPENSPQILTLRRLFCTGIEEWIRHRKRRTFLEAAAKLELPLTIFGNGFDAVEDEFPDFDIRGPADIGVILAAMGRARMVMNVNPYFGEGAHERPLTAMLAGAAVASDTSTFFEQAFVSGRDMLLYPHRAVETGLQQALDLSENPDALFRMARAGQHAVLSGHRWKDRIETYIAAAHAAADRQHRHTGG